MRERITDGAGSTGRGPRRARVGPAAVLLALALCDAGRSTEAAAITIMPLGDSITTGASSPDPVPGGYRSVLYRDLTAAGYAPTFVGSLAENPDPSLPPAAQQEEGHTGWLIAGSAPYFPLSLAGNIDRLLAPGNGIDPDLILLQAGTNNFIARYHEAAAPYELAALIARIGELRPNAEVLVSTITPLSDPAYNARVQAFNKALGGPDGIVAQLRERGGKVVLVDAGGSVAVSDLSVDGAHPNRAGYIKLGRAWSDAIQAYRPAGPGLPGPAPEPSTLAVIGAGLLGLVVVGRARSSSRSVDGK